MGRPTKRPSRVPKVLEYPGAYRKGPAMTPIEEVAREITHEITSRYLSHCDCEDKCDQADCWRCKRSKDIENKVGEVLSRPATLAKLRPRVENELLRAALEGVRTTLSVGLGRSAAPNYVFKNEPYTESREAAAELRTILEAK